MNDMEERLRRSLRTGRQDVDPDRLLGDVRLGAVRRRRRRIAAVIATASLIVAGIAGVASQVDQEQGGAPEPLPSTQSPSPTPSLPDDAARGVVDVVAVSPELVFRLTVNVGCVACSTVWKHDPSADGGWTRLHDFTADPGTDRTAVPVWNFVMGETGRDGWAWGDHLHATHDGGRTWSRIAFGPGLPTDSGYAVMLTGGFAWSLSRTGQAGTQLFRTPIGTDEWSTVEAPALSGASGMLTAGEAVVLQTSDEGLADARLGISTDGGATWSRLDLPCAGEPRVRPGVSEVFALCTGTNDMNAVSVYRSRGLSRWELVGRWTGVVDTFQPLADDRVLLARSGGRAVLITPDRSTAVDLGSARETGIYESASVGDLVFLVAYDGNSAGSLLRSTDGGLTWQTVE